MERRIEDDVLPPSFSRSLIESLLDAQDYDSIAAEMSGLDADQKLLPAVRPVWFEYLWRSGQSDLLLDEIRRLRQLHAEDRHATSVAALYRARLEYRDSRIDAAIETLSLTLADPESPSRFPTLDGDLHQLLGKCWLRRREIGPARDQLRMALGCFERASDLVRVGQTLDILGQLETLGQNWGRCRAMQVRALRLFLEAGDLRSWLICALNMTTAHIFRGEFLSATALLRRCLPLAEELQLESRVARARRLLGLLLTRQVRHADARRAVREAIRATARVEEPRGRALLCEYVGEFRLAGGYLARARRWLTRGHFLAFRNAERDVMGETQRLLAEVEFQSKNTATALKLAEEAIDTFLRTGEVDELAVCRRVRGGILLHLGRTAEAVHDLERAVDFFTQMGERFEIYRAQRLLALARGEAIDDAETVIATLGRSYDAEGARLRAELEANEVDPIADLLKQPFPANANRLSAGGPQAADHGADAATETDTAGNTDLTGNTDPAITPPNPTWPLTREQIEESISQARLRTIHLLRTATNPGFPELHGKSPLLRAALRQVREAAPTDQPILIQGETGTGKELVARAVHDLSRRARGPYVPVNCGALSPEMLDSEVFGHQKGAFTGAITERAGLARTASGGTLFLDEIAELGSGSQPRLLRMLDSGEIRPVGADRAIKVDVRLVTATHKDLRQAIEANEFRRDLYHRLCGLTIYLPALRDRIDDLPILIEHFAQQLRERGIEFVGVSDAVLTSMSAYDWPGKRARAAEPTLRPHEPLPAGTAGDPVVGAGRPAPGDRDCARTDRVADRRGAPLAPGTGTAGGNDPRDQQAGALPPVRTLRYRLRELPVAPPRERASRVVRPAPHGVVPPTPAPTRADPPHVRRTLLDSCDSPRGPFDIELSPGTVCARQSLGREDGEPLRLT
ncbi:MAG: sigma 54-interacting transcriptional regulator [Candidatus Eisenbacteria bacterium]|nr:sigma 54-interacting transcriptional regulator [Candidatus Eisenbacteria bacterium]